MTITKNETHILLFGPLRLVEEAESLRLRLLMTGTQRSSSEPSPESQ